MVFESERIDTRLAILSGIVLFLLGIVLIRLWFLQILTGEEYLTIAKENRIRVVSIDAPRGNIYDRQGNILVRNRGGLCVSMTLPTAEETAKEKKERELVMARLSPLLEMRVEEIKKKLKSKRADPYKPIPIKEDVSEEIAARIEEHQLDFPHVVIEGMPIREYLNGNLAAHLLGYLGEVTDEELKQDKFKDYRPGDVMGREGVENSYETFLAGRKGEQRIEVNAAGYPVHTTDVRSPEAGSDVYLTIDKNLQGVVENLLHEALDHARQSYDETTKKYYLAPAGSAVVMNPNTGEILAMASQPSYDPRLFIGGISKDAWAQLNDPNNHYPLTNRAVASSYPPGSVMKLVTMSAGLSEGVTTPGTGYDCTGKWQGAGAEWPQYCWNRSGHGHLNLEEGLVESCDSVFYQIGLEFYKQRTTRGEKLQEYAARFGLGEPTEIDLPGEDAGRIPTRSWKEKWNKGNPEYQIWYPGDSTNLAVGQGDVLTTPLQMAVAYSALANGGTIYQPHVVKRVQAGDGRLVKGEPHRKLKELGLSADVLDVVRRNLVEVPRSGTAKSAFIGFPFDSVSVAGKTGSAEVYGKQSHAWFVCYAPAQNPKYVVAVMIEEGGHGSAAAAPLARKIVENLFGIRSDFGVRVESTVD